MMATMDLASLTQDGDTLELGDGRTLRLRIEPDPDYSINDYDSDGKIAWGRRDANTGWDRRPEGFDGNAEKLDVYEHSVALWWQPHESLTAKRGTPEWSAERTRIRDLAVYGFKSVRLELLEGTDAYGRPVVVKFDSVGGVDEVYPELVEDLAGELGL